MRRLVGLLIAVCILAAACGSGGGAQAPSGPPEGGFLVTREGTRCVYEGPEELVAGAVDVVFFNAVDEKVGFHFARLHEDVAYSMYRETIQHEPVGMFFPKKWNNNDSQKKGG